LDERESEEERRRIEQALNSLDAEADSHFRKHASEE
jgi:hypothetical protein